MDKKNLMPQQAQPIERITTGQLPTELAELSEEALVDSSWMSDSSSVLPSVLPSAQGCSELCSGWFCSYDGEDAE
jgi:bacteriocin leader peptide (microcyclamide/patellamide family)